MHYSYIKTATFKYGLPVIIYMESQSEPECGHLCKECASWNRHKEKCWFFWEGKKECSQFKDDDFSEPKYKDVKFNPDEHFMHLIDRR
jgi:hypothetical protein